MQHDLPSLDAQIAQLNDELCRGTDAPRGDLARLLRMDPVIVTAVALGAGFLVGLRPGLLRQAMTLGGLLVNWACPLSLSATRRTGM